MGDAAWSVKPCALLAPYVDLFAFRDDDLGSMQIYNPLPARGDCFLQFYFEDRYRVVTVTSGAVHLAPRCVLVGPHTRRREDLLCTGHLKMFTINFSPVGFRALFGIPARLMREFAGSAESVLGGEIAELEDRLASVEPAELVAVAEAFLLNRLMAGRVLQDGGAIAKMVRDLKQKRGVISVAEMAAAHEVSTRQVERAFQEHVGVAPKVYGRMERLKFAMKLGGAENTDWAEVAVAAGFFDQSHMVREFKDFNGATPVQFMAMRRRVMELERTELRERDVAFVLSRAQVGKVALGV